MSGQDHGDGIIREIKLYMDLKQFRQYIDIYVLYIVNITDIH